jgi:cyclic beta-1,2-glucan synthetase
MSLGSEPPSIYTLHQLEQLGASLAVRHQRTFDGGMNTLIARLKHNEEVLRNTYRLLSNLIAEGHRTTPASDWLLDNFHVIEEQIRLSKLHLPKNFSRELPLVDDPVWKCQPRIYVLARELIDHTDACLDNASACCIINTYQKLTPLRIGELWAFPIMLRLGLLDNLRQISESVAASHIDQHNAMFWASRIAKTAATKPNTLLDEINQLAQSEPRLSSAFVSEFTRRIQTHCQCPSIPLSWMEQRVSEHGASVEHHQNMASRGQAHDQMSISNSIASLRFLSDTDWRNFVEKMSHIEAILRQDPAGAYPKMDFATRDAYRHSVEYASRFSDSSESEVAEAVIMLAKRNQSNGTSESSQHIGEFLLGHRKSELKRHLKVKSPLDFIVQNLINSAPLAYFFSLLFVFSAALAWIPLRLLSLNSEFTSVFLLTSALLLLSVSQSSLAMVNWVTTLILKPRIWPRMDFSAGVPSTARTVVVIPSMLCSAKMIEKLVGDLEVRFLGNRDPNILFALLTDFVDADSEVLPADEALLKQVEKAIVELNDKYSGTEPSQSFFLFHRSRRWNNEEQVWMGYERKRGKLMEFNAWLKDHGKDRFSSIIGPSKEILDIRYVITLDCDSTLPRDTASQLIATMAHPINQPTIDASTNTVRRGYAILQPRVTIHLQDPKASRFTRLFSDDFGIDPYTKSVSDVYQDLFLEGTFIGKGIYDVEAFQRSLEFRFPENRILSHDLIESGFARSGLVSDIQLIEEYPTTYLADASRRHRWMRGDWQIASWMLPMVPREGQTKQANPLSGVARWKIFDNIRRCLNPLATIALLFFGWAKGGTISTSLTSWILGYMAFPHLLHALNFRIWRTTPFSASLAIREQSRLIIRSLALWLFSVVLLPFDAYLSADAGVRSIYRMMISKRKLLQWRTAGDAERTNDQQLSAYLKLLWFTPAAAAIGLFLATFGNSAVTLGTCSIALAWLGAPFATWWISQPVACETPTLRPVQIDFLRALARRTWRFFEVFVTEEDNWLPPDNFQEFPTDIIAHRTSPTNVGLALLSTLGAFDFGYISIEVLLDRLEAMFSSLDKMERFKGHFFNWYDTQTLKPLVPFYISTVDSGNLAGSLLTLSRGLDQISHGSLASPRILEGLDDVLLALNNLVRDDAVSDGMLSSIKYAKKFRHMQRELASAKIPSMVSEMEIIDSLGLFQEPLNKLRIHLSNQLQPESTVLIDCKDWIRRLDAQATSHRQSLSSMTTKKEHQIRGRLRDLAHRATEMTKQDYAFLYNKENKLLSIGFNTFDLRRDNSYYDLLASEARMASFLAIAGGSVPQEHWFALGRHLTISEGVPTLLSWSGSMFEYLMPLLIFPSHEGTILEQSCRQCILRQVQYGKDRNVPWGISESGYNLTDAQYNYQYRAFGVPGLGFKRGLDQDLVVAPYATVMALMLEPLAACSNLEAMSRLGYEGKYGFFEAVDFTPARLPTGESHVILKSFMAHHQGMSFLSLLRFLLNEPMQRRLESEPTYKATELLLHERIPKSGVGVSNIFLGANLPPPAAAEEDSFRILTNPNSSSPDVHLLGNGRYTTMISSSGAGYSKWNDLLVTRWREDRIQDSYGFFIYVKDFNTSETWSIGYQPLSSAGEDYKVIFTEGRAEIRRTDHGLETHLEVCVSPDDDIELRRLSITNHTEYMKTIEVTSYAEVVLAPLGADVAHPAFSNLFVETEVIGNQKAILCRRRAKEPDQKNPWLYHALVVHDGKFLDMGIETDRSEFIGRNRDLSSPRALTAPLTNSSGPVLDPIISMRKQISIESGSTVVIDCLMGISETRETAVNLVERYSEKQISDRIMELAWTHGRVLLQQLNCTAADAIFYGKIAASIIYGGPDFRATSAIIKANQRPLSSFWSYGISGDLPIVLLRVHKMDSLQLLQQVVRGHDYWRRKGLIVDLVIWIEDHSAYRQELHDRILEVIAAASSSSLLDKHGGLFIRRPDQMPDEDKTLFQAHARLILSDSGGSLQEQLDKRNRTSSSLPQALPSRWRLRNRNSLNISKTILTKDEQDSIRDTHGMNHLHRQMMSGDGNPMKAPKPRVAAMGNGLGDFSEDGKEYLIRIQPGNSTPMPWINVLANPQFGSIISESGSAYTWSENCKEHRLTPWFNDPVCDPSGEVLYIRDEQNGQYWTATPAPCPGSDAYNVRHGFGYSGFETTENGITSDMTVFVDAIDPVKIVSLKVTNISNRRRKLSMTAYYELVLGENREKSASQIVTESDPSQNLLFARNVFSSDFFGRVAFFTATSQVGSFTGDRAEFIGRNRSVSHPAAMDRVKLSGQIGALFDPCMALQIFCELAPGETREVAFTMGSGRDIQTASKLSRKFSSLSRVHIALAEVRRYWTTMVDRIQITTPDKSLNNLANGWLMYQTIASRLFGRTGFYQSGGAYGFRDQLQDIMAIVHCAPKIAREHIIRCAGRQFPEGDVQHWWHPPKGRGVRTQISDDYLWLPYVIEHYIRITGDWAILDERTPYLNAKPLIEHQESDYSMPTVSDDLGSVYEHCVKSLKYGMKLGSHGLPLMGSGDWNDGMNFVGNHGSGESIWLAFFLLDTLNRFTWLAEHRSDSGVAEYCRTGATLLKSNVAEHGWDGDWYLRAYFDDGSRLGSTQNQECRIDSLPQSWAVLSGGATADRAEMAMDSVYQKLVQKEAKLIQLFDPPFDHQLPNPGYINGYLRGVRENGGQYTHAAIWVVMAFAHLGQHDRAMELLTLVNPVQHAKSREAINRYKVEPYVIAADVYAVAPHTGRGGWTWYTGSSAWFYRAILETFLGFDPRGETLRIHPKIPSTWPAYSIKFWHRDTQYTVDVTNGDKGNRGNIQTRENHAQRIFVDNLEIEDVDNSIELVNDKMPHVIKIELVSKFGP